jgi:isopentenyldiphosphate isomerase
MNINKTTDPQDELLTEVDENNKVIGPIPRGIAHKSSKIYRTIAIFVKNSSGKYLWQKRSDTKDLYPNCWEGSAGGHVDFGYTYIDTAIRELEEELGIVASKNELVFLGEVLVKLPSSREFFHAYEYSLKSNDHIRLAEDETGDIMWMTMGEAQKSIREQKLQWYPRPIQLVKALFSSEK